MQLDNATSQTSLPESLRPQYSENATELIRGNQLGSERVAFPISSLKNQNELQEKDNHTLTTVNGDKKILLLATITPLIEERLLRDKQNKHFYLTLSSRVVLKRIKVILHVLRDFKDGLTTDTIDKRIRENISVQSPKSNLTGSNNKPNPISSGSRRLPIFQYKKRMAS